MRSCPHITASRPGLRQQRLAAWTAKAGTRPGHISCLGRALPGARATAPHRPPGHPADDRTQKRLHPDAPLPTDYYERLVAWKAYSCAAAALAGGEPPPGVDIASLNRDLAWVRRRRRGPRGAAGRRGARRARSASGWLPPFPRTYAKRTTATTHPVIRRHSCSTCSSHCRRVTSRGMTSSVTCSRCGCSGAAARRHLLTPPLPSLRPAAAAHPRPHAPCRLGLHSPLALALCARPHPQPLLEPRAGLHLRRLVTTCCVATLCAQPILRLPPRSCSTAQRRRPTLQTASAACGWSTRQRCALWPGEGEGGRGGGGWGRRGRGMGVERTQRAAFVTHASTCRPGCVGDARSAVARVVRRDWWYALLAQLRLPLAGSDNNARP